MVESACPFCKRSFGAFLWRHECSICKVVVCDDCAPKTDGRRRCPPCLPRHTATEHQQRSSSALNADLNEAEEREKRLRAVESRMKAAQQRGKPQEQRPVKSTAPTNTNNNTNTNNTNTTNTNNTNNTTTTIPQAEVTAEVPRSSSVNNTEKATSSGATQEQVDENPMLDAVLRRRQQEQSKMTANRNNSAEKTQLLAEILSILNQRGEEEPFGLRAMDETKLQSYLRYIKSKEKGTGGV